VHANDAMSGLIRLESLVAEATNAPQQALIAEAVIRRTQASLGHKEGVDPKVAADQRGHAIGVAVDTYTESDPESRREAVTKLERALAGRKPAEQESETKSSAQASFRGKRGKTA